MCTSCNVSELFYSGKQGVLKSFILLASWFGGGLAWFLLLLFVFLLLLFLKFFLLAFPLVELRVVKEWPQQESDRVLGSAQRLGALMACAPCLQTLEDHMFLQ